MQISRGGGGGSCRQKANGRDVTGPGSEEVLGDRSVVDNSTAGGRAEGNVDPPHQQEPIRTVSITTHLRVKGANSSRSIYEKGSQIGGCQEYDSPCYSVNIEEKPLDAV